MANLTTENLNQSRNANGEMPLGQLAHVAGQKVGNMASQYAHTTASAIKSTEDYVKEHPLKGTAYAAAAGLVAGSLLTMAFRSPRQK